MLRNVPQEQKQSSLTLKKSVEFGDKRMQLGMGQASENQHSPELLSATRKWGRGPFCDNQADSGSSGPQVSSIPKSL